MKLDKKLLWYGIPILIGGFLIYKQLKRGKKTTPAFPPYGGGGNTSGGDSSSSGGGISSGSDSYPLKRGSKGANVVDLQKKILGIDKTLLPKYGADGDFGAETEAAVQTLLGKKVVEWNDYLILLDKYNRINFPMMFPAPPSFPTYDPYKILGF